MYFSLFTQDQLVHWFLRFKISTVYTNVHKKQSRITRTIEVIRSTCNKEKILRLQYSKLFNVAFTIQ